MSGIGRTGSGFGGVSGLPEPEPVTTGAGASTPAAGGTTSTSTSARTTAASGASAADVWATITKGPRSGPTPAGVNLDASGARRPVALGQNGRFTPTPGRDASAPAAIASGLFHAASLIDDSKENLFDAMKMPADGRAKMLANLKADLATVPAGGRSPAGLTDIQALQMRSSGSTVLLELLSAKDTSAALKGEALALYTGMLKAETNPTLKDGMALHLHRLRDTLPTNLRAQVDAAKEIAAPQKPPYDAWFKNGNSKVNVAWSAGSESLQDDITLLKKNGFTVTGSANGATTLSKTYDKNGVKTTFDVTIRPFRSDMFKEASDDKSQMVVYTGHSNWGRNMRDSLANAPAGNAAGGKDKLILADLCVGKGEMQMVKDKFPNADLVTTFTSSYFIESEGGRNEPESEGIHAILQTFDGIAGRKGYEAIAEKVHEANPWGYDHELEGIDNNFIFPTDVATRRKVLDADHDGQADIFDRLIDFSTTNVAEDTAREFTPVQGPRDAAKLNGSKLHFAAMTVNRLTIYSEVFHPKNSDSKVVPGGYFEPRPGETNLFRFSKTKVDGKDAIIMQGNARYAHMSEEALRMAASFEYSRYMTSQGGIRMSKEDANITGMILASHSLDTDSGYRDEAVWKEFQKAYNLPEISRMDVEGVKEANHDWYSGSKLSITELKKLLTPAQLEGLKAPKAGQNR